MESQYIKNLKHAIDTMAKDMQDNPTTRTMLEIMDDLCTKLSIAIETGIKDCNNCVSNNNGICCKECVTDCAYNTANPYNKWSHR